MNSGSEVEQLLELIECGRALDRLKSNPDYVRVFGMLYFHKHKDAMVAMLATQVTTDKSWAISELEALSRIQYFLESVTISAGRANQDYDHYVNPPMREYDNE